MTRKFTIGTRGSDLALWQANFVRSALEGQFPDRSFEISIIKTTGDETVDIALSKIGDKGLFTRQIETELIEGRIDLAVHSLKDLQTAQPDGVMIGAICKREVPNDVFIGRWVATIADLAKGARVATGSLRRRSQLLNYRPDLEIVEIRGNVPTRLAKFDAADLDGLILAYAGVHRLGLGARVSQLIPFDIMLPAVGQGAVAVELRADDEEMRTMAAALDHVDTSVCVAAERAFLRRLEGGCQVPIGAYAHLDGESLRLEGMVGGLDGVIVYRDAVNGPRADAADLGVRLAEMLIERGADKLLADDRAASGSSAKAVI